MALRHISFLQLGDVHYPDLLKATPTVDHKDKGISASIANAIGSPRIADIARRLSQVRVAEPNLAAVLLCGDLTTRGRFEGYSDCLAFLNTTLQLADKAYWAERRLIVVPGNHDIDRNKIALGQMPAEKFLLLEAEWKRLCGSGDYLATGMPHAIDLPVNTTLQRTPSIRFLPLNTCFLCGEHRAFPEAIRQKVQALLSELKQDISDDDFQLMMSEQIDCPAVEREHVDELQRLIIESEEESVSVVLGHHPLFPQPTPRIDGYAELLNAGFVRERLLATKRNVIYLHGHIHQEPVLVVNSPGKGSNRILHISAPALEDGFNLCRIFYSDQTNQPLGLELVPYRFGNHLGIEPGDSITLRLIDSDSLWNEVDQDWLDHILSRLATPRTILRFSDLMRNIPEGVKGGLTVEEQSAAVKEALIVLELLELVVISNRDRSEKLWQCRRTSV